MKEERGPLRAETRRAYRFPIFVRVNRRVPAGVCCTCSSDPESTFAFTLRVVGTRADVVWFGLILSSRDCSPPNTTTLTFIHSPLPKSSSPAEKRKLRKDVAIIISRDTSIAKSTFSSCKIAVSQGASNAPTPRMVSHQEWDRMERLGPVMSRNDAAVQTLWKSELRGGRPEPGEVN
jgi:hypothetical protein